MTRFTPAFLRFPSAARLMYVLLAVSAAILIAGCSSTGGGERDETTDWTAAQLYQSAREEVDSGNWNTARTRLEAIEARYPFGTHAQQALIDLAYVNWKDDEPEQALATIDRFQQQYPEHPGTDYMLYLKGLITFTPPSAVFSRITQQDPSERDPKGLRESYDSFNELVQRYPDSRYSTDARKRLTWLVNAIAQNEVHVAEYYYKRGAYVAAINRAQTVITDFEGVPAAEKALAITYLAYDKLGMTDLRDDTKRVLDQNFPDSVYLSRGLDEPSGSKWNPINWF